MIVSESWNDHAIEIGPAPKGAGFAMPNGEEEPISSRGLLTPSDLIDDQIDPAWPYTPRARFAQWRAAMRTPVKGARLERARQATLWLAENYGSHGDAMYVSHIGAAEKYGCTRKTWAAYMSTAVEQCWLDVIVSPHPAPGANGNRYCYKKRLWWEPFYPAGTELPPHDAAHPPF